MSEEHWNLEGEIAGSPAAQNIIDPGTLNAINRFKRSHTPSAAWTERGLNVYRGLRIVGIIGEHRGASAEREKTIVA
jgi:hypothetical protein